MEEEKGLSQEELVNCLRGRGYQDVKIRNVRRWCELRLLPPFDVRGASLGRPLGREPSRWTNEQHIVRRSICILELLNLYGSYSYVYVPLWLLGYSIEFDCIRKSLSEQLERMISRVEHKCKSDCNMEDVLYDEACDLTEQLRHEPSPWCELPHDALSLVLNVLMNPNLDWTDSGAFESLQTWLQRCEQVFQTGRNGSSEAPVSNQPDTINSLMKGAALLKEYLSVSKISQAVEESNDDDLRVVEHDLLILRKLLSSNLPTDCQVPRAMVLRGVLGIGEIAIWIDLSFRKHGLGRDIDALLSESLMKVQMAYESKFKNESSEVSEKQMRHARPLDRSVGL